MRTLRADFCTCSVGRGISFPTPGRIVRTKMIPKMTAQIVVVAYSEIDRNAILFESFKSNDPIADMMEDVSKGTIKHLSMRKNKSPVKI